MLKAEGASISMVRWSSKVLIGNSIAERHDMITAGDMDCQNSWIILFCVRVVKIDLEVPSMSDKGILAKARHEEVPYSSKSKISGSTRRRLQTPWDHSSPPQAERHILADWQQHLKYLQAQDRRW
ncbi:hypothetical protein BGZ72_001205 [Mortierella alpina]|nr:hypothetical protein BGZ72_001205 [Mortierella alpina]